MTKKLRTVDYSNTPKTLDDHPFFGLELDEEQRAFRDAIWSDDKLIIFADDTYPRWVTTASLLDYDTVAGADKFGNICVVS